LPLLLSLLLLLVPLMPLLVPLLLLVLSLELLVLLLVLLLAPLLWLLLPLSRKSTGCVTWSPPALWRPRMRLCRVPSLVRQCLVLLRTCKSCTPRCVS